MTSFGVADQRLRDAEALPHAAGEPSQLLLANVEEVDSLQQGIDRHFALSRIDHAFEPREVVEELVRRHLGIDAEILRQVAQHGAHSVGLAQDVDVAAVARFRESALCSVASVRISVDLPAPLGPSRPNMPGATMSDTRSSACTPLP